MKQQLVMWVLLASITPLHAQWISLPTWMGYSVGRWQGDTVVVESNGYNDKTWLNSRGVSHTGQLFMQRGGAGRTPLAAQSETAFLPQGGGLSYVFTVKGDGVASAIPEVRVSGAWSYDRAPE
ncbi:MAG: hypothetical protein OXQ29_11840 [Rhodospirillaceae bacterium]|nr:hypothetical protein [Rhodospirillaceae bacterium]